jgi:hypothetical protein
VRYSTVVNGVGLHDVASGVVISSTVERRKDVGWYAGGPECSLTMLTATCVK